MTPLQQVVLRQTLPSIVTQKVQLTYKLFLLENARNTLEQELLHFTNKAYEEVQGFLNSSLPANVFSDLATTLDAKCQAVVKLSTLLKDHTVGSQVCARNGATTNHLKPRKDKRIHKTDVLKFGPMLQNSLMLNSIAKAVQVLGATHSLQHFKNVFFSQPAVVQQDDLITVSSSSHLKAEENDDTVVVKEKCSPDVGAPVPAVIQSPEISTKRPPPPPPLLLPPLQAIFPVIRNPKPMKITPLMSWGCGEDVQVQHQKLTSSQLLHFLRAKVKSMEALEVTVMEWSKSMSTPDSPQPMSPAIKTQTYQFRQVVTEDLMTALAPKALHTGIENHAPVFRRKRVERVESSGSLTYTCVIATKTELWDIGDIFTEVGQDVPEAQPLEDKGCQNVTTQVENSENIQLESQTHHHTEPEHKKNPAEEKAPAIINTEIPEFQVRKFEETEVVVSHIVSPGNFYIQHADFISKLQALIMHWKASSSYAEQNCIPDIGTHVMGWFPKHEQWCRARVTKICGVSGDNDSTDGAGSERSIKVEVKRLDYGDTACLSVLNIKELTPEMTTLPLQAAKVSLANVTPVNGGDWSEEAVGWFQAMVHNRTLYARLYPQGPKVTVELFLEKGKLGAMRRGASLSLRLAQNGHAKHNKLKNFGPVKRSAGQVKMKKQDSEWEKYLISCYTQNRDHEGRECL
ncbi:uncharacterized protein LOC117816899 isoform X2 [Notolabrus celidotus]|uniref:uncharacterized protein LOC117816899 isoform X2 n=1 Tax=Notolabrus celidotus TaxID=1203425 RepID=UPI00148F90FD|nr:uncharacterized protein LOC117816899 isoform X2 [Notolabrus celidotus]